MIYLETARERSNPYRFQIYIDVIAIQLSYKLTHIYIYTRNLGLG